MLGSTPISAILGSGVDGTDHEAVKSFIRAACGEGLSLLLIQPGTKVPADMRTVRQRNAADREASQAARDAGRADWEKVKSASGLALASSDAKTVIKYLDEYISRYGDDVAVNLAVEVGASRLVVVDCDTRGQYERFIEVSGAPPLTPPTVSTPGQRDPRTGEMVHSDGGHFYFTVPDGVELPETPGAMTWGGDDGFAVLWNRRYVLIPPSVRPEGSYELSGGDHPLPSFLRDAILDRGARRAAQAERKAEETSDLTENIDAWSQTITWKDILEPLGWTPTPRVDNCGCDVWTAPGPHGSTKSATAHDSGCALGRYTETNAPLHIWTDSPGEPFETWIADHETKTVTKLQAVALTEYEGNIGKAMDVLGIIPDLSISSEVGVDVKKNLGDEDVNADAVSEELTLPDTQPADTAETPDTVEVSDDEHDPDVWVPSQKGVPTIAPFSHWRNMPPPEFIVEGLIEHGGLSSIIGAPGTGKSTVALDMACHIATGRTWLGRNVLKTKVLYLPGEGLSGAVQRLRAWEHMHGVELGNDLLLGGEIIRLGASREAWSELCGYIISKGIELVIFDTFARMALDIEENSATAVGKAVERFDQVRKLTSAGVMVVHHTAKNSTSSRGSSALNGALESELLITAPERDEEPGKPLLLDTTKQKNAEQLEEPLELRMMNCTTDDLNAPYITGPSGSLDPFNGVITLARPLPEPLVETAIRIRQFVDRFTQQGVTRSDIRAGVHPDPYTLRARDVTRAWKAKVDEAVDRALHYQLIETLSGTPSGARYVPGGGTPDRARAQAAAEGITEITLDPPGQPAD